MNMAVDDKTTDGLATIATARIFFGHHSVGDNIVSGLLEIAEETGFQIRLASFEEEKIPEDGPVFLHMRPGENGNPKRKIDEFFSTLEDQAGLLRPDLALMKLCYVDIRPETNAEELADYYIRRAQSAASALGEDMLVHVTTPLMARPKDIKSRLQRLLGKTVWVDASNKKRQDYNDRIARAFPEATLFDLAGSEALAPDGAHSNHDDPENRSLWPGYTDDGGHLNRPGRRAIAKVLVGALREALDAKRERSDAAR